MSVDVPLDNININTIAPISVGISAVPPININGKLEPVKLTTDSKLATDSKLVTDNKLVTDSKVVTDSKLVSNSKLDTDSKVVTDSKLLTDNDVDLNVAIKELPLIDLQFGLRPMRFHFPINYQFCIKLFGCKVFEFKTCGEGMIVAEDYTEKATERCN